MQINTYDIESAFQIILPMKRSMGHDSSRSTVPCGTRKQMPHFSFSLGNSELLNAQQTLRRGNDSGDTNQSVEGSYLVLRILIGSW
ncbi:hypothetical protein TNCV_821271 [Trichonephila clavipes]|nr:hypothetical protein TNCV_821271 [Trichonephila clavipes]